MPFFSYHDKETEVFIMRDFSIDLIWTKAQIAITAIGGWVGYFVGGMDGMLIALIIMMALDSFLSITAHMRPLM